MTAILIRPVDVYEVQGQMKLKLEVLEFDGRVSRNQHEVIVWMPVHELRLIRELKRRFKATTVAMQDNFLIEREVIDGDSWFVVH